MGLLDLFQKGEDPQERYVDDLLGPMVWSKDDEAWAGEKDAVRYLLAYEGRAMPQRELLAYARLVLSDPQTFRGAIHRAKQAAVAENSWLADEIAGLRLETVLFYRYKGMCRILADLMGGQEGAHGA